MISKTLLHTEVKNILSPLIRSGFPVFTVFWSHRDSSRDICVAPQNIFWKIWKIFHSENDSFQGRSNTKNKLLLYSQIIPCKCLTAFSPCFCRQVNSASSQLSFSKETLLSRPGTLIRFISFSLVLLINSSDPGCVSFWWAELHTLDNSVG